MGDFTLYGYCITNDDETDCLQNALSSMARIPVDRFLLINSGTQKALIHHQRLFQPLREWLASRKEYNAERETWNEMPLVVIDEPFTDPAHMRNFALRWIEQNAPANTWIVAIDSDEVESTEAERGMRELLAGLPDDVTNVVQPLANLVQDERHIAGSYHSDWLCHARLHRVGTDKVWYVGSWHESEEYKGNRVKWNARIIHQRMLYRRRLYLQRGHPFLRDAWGDLQMVDLPSDVSFSPLEWPKDEAEIPFLEDIRTYMGGKYA